LKGLVFISDENSEIGAVGPALQRGVYLRLEGPERVADFICALFDIPLETMVREVKTVLLNNSVVDDFEDARLYPGDTLVLSGAMPGLVGAMLRSGSPLKSMREGATAGVRSVTRQAEALVRLKLFNTVIKRFGEKLLRHGFYIEADRTRE
jgi:hypothetical protein